MVNGAKDSPRVVELGWDVTEKTVGWVHTEFDTSEDTSNQAMQRTRQPCQDIAATICTDRWQRKTRRDTSGAGWTDKWSKTDSCRCSATQAKALGFGQQRTLVRGIGKDEAAGKVTNGQKISRTTLPQCAVKNAENLKPSHTTGPGVGLQDSTRHTEAELDALKMLQWDKVCNQLACFSSTPFGRDKINQGQMPIGRTLQESMFLLDQTEAAVRINDKLASQSHATIADILAKTENIDGILRMLEEKLILQAADLAAVTRTMKAAEELSLTLEKCTPPSTDSKVSTSLLCVSPRLSDRDRDLIDSVEKCISLDGNFVKDEASESLREVRFRIKDLNSRIKDEMESIAREMYIAGAADRARVSLRRGRLCIAVKASRHSELPGGSVVLDRSSSGLTYFAEPVSLLPLNNKLVDLKFQEQEIVKDILSYLSMKAMSCQSSLNEMFLNLESLDLAFTRAGHAAWMGAVKPVLVDIDKCNILFDVKNAMHPLLVEGSLPSLPSAHGSIRRAKPRLSPTPITLEVPSGIHTVIMTGPNTGGKTASIKTAAILAMMAKCGLFIPASQPARLAWFDQVLADIGDSQSLEQSLSTFSGHVKKLIRILRSSTCASLVLLDELGSGTDPTEGSALATATIEKFNRRAALTLVTTHHAELKDIATRDPEVMNAAVEFDLPTLKPTYRILWGTTGDSMALQVARTVGLKEEILVEAEGLLKRRKLQGGESHSEYESLQEQLESSKSMQREAETLLKKSKIQHSRLSSECRNLKERALLLDDVADADALKEEKEMKELVESTILELNESSISFDAALAILEELEEHAMTMANSYIEKGYGIQRPEGWMPQVGQAVLVPKLGYVSAVIRSISNGSLMVEAGHLKLALSEEEVCPTVQDEEDIRKEIEGTGNYRIPGAEGTVDTVKNESVASVKDFPSVQLKRNTLDIRGKRVEDAEMLLDDFLSRSGKGAVFIVHGVGTGKLMRSVHAFLKGHPEVKRFQVDKTSAGGCTVAFVK